MRQNFTLLLVLFSLYGFAQLYVQEGTTLSLGSPQAVLSSQESSNQINAPFLGEGALILNSASKQRLTSSQDVLELPTLHIENADLVQLQTAFNIQNQLHVAHGQLTLLHPITLPNPTSLVLGQSAGILTTPQGPLVYNTQFETSNPLAFLNIQPFLQFIEPKTPPTTNSVVLDFIQRSNFVTFIHTNYNWNFKPYTPPPKAV